MTATCYFCNRQLPPPGEGDRGLRQLLKRALQKLGAQVDERVSAETNYLIVGIKPSPAKLKKAQQLGVKLVCGECAIMQFIKGTTQ